MEPRRRDGPLNAERVAYRLGLAASHWVQVSIASDVSEPPDKSYAAFSLITRDGNFIITVEEFK